MKGPCHRARSLLAVAPALALACACTAGSPSTRGQNIGSLTPSAGGALSSGPIATTVGSTSKTPTQVASSTSAAASAEPSPSVGASTAAAPSPSAVAPTFATFSPATTYALPAAVAAYAGKDIVVLPTKQHVVALTFDAGANADAVPEILATLHDENVPGTFFLTGAWVRSYPARAAEIAQHYPVGSHSNTHPYFTKLANAQLQNELDAARQSITNATGHDPRPLFRFPFGDRDTPTRNFVNSQGYISVFWTVDTLGWEGTSGGQSVASVVNRVKSHLQPGEIVLMHVGSHPTDHSTLDGDALRTVIDDLKAAGYGFVTVPQGLGLTP